MIEIEVSFRDKLAVGRATREGWGEAEAGGTWMTGPVSRLVLPPPPRHDGAFELRATIGPYLVPGKIDAQRIRILVNGVAVFETAMRRVWQIACPIPPEAMARQPRVEIIIEHPDAVSPASIGSGDDLRELAASVWSLTLLGTSPLPTERAPVFTQPHFVTRPMGNLANRMIQHMVARAVQEAAPNCAISGLDISEWGIIAPPDSGTWADLALVDEQRVDVAGVAALLSGKTVTKIVHRGYGQRMANFLPREAYTSVFASHEPDITAYNAQHLLINIRTGDVVAGTIGPYVLIPFSFYRQLIEQTGLIPVFMGQLEPNAYTEALRAAFPDAKFHESQGPLRDFETIRRAANIVVAVSTFSWLAAWLSEAQTIHLPVNGLFNPRQFPSVDLLPLDDPRYRFWLFPVNEAAPDFAAAHAAIEGQWREVSAAELATIRAEADAPAHAEAPVQAPVARVIPPIKHDAAAIIAAAETAALRGHAADALHHLRRLPLPDFAELLWSLPRDDLPRISDVLPRMASDEVQLRWNGKSGPALCADAVDLCRIIDARFRHITGRSLDHRRILDFGCGWGRLTRMMMYHTDPQNICAVDAMDQSVAQCRADGLLGRIVRSDYIARDLDVGDAPYDLIISHGVFTHTPMPVARVLMATLRRKLSRHGLLALTVRPVELWSQLGHITPEQRDALVRSHHETGSAYLSLDVTSATGEEIYGEATISPSWFAANCPDWEVESIERGMDEMHLIIFLTPR